MRSWILALGLVCVSASASSQINQAKATQKKDWWDREFWSRLTYSGSRTLGYQTYRYEGDTETFRSLTNFGTGGQHFTDIGNLSIQGSKVFGFFDFRTTFTDNRFSDPEQQQYLLNYRKNAWDLNYGTVQASLNTSNRFVSFSRSLTGFMGSYRLKDLEVKHISSTARGAARTVTIEGNNTLGPYYLQSGRIIGGSVEVNVDGTEMKQGVDFILDSSVGSITFINRVIAPTSTILASYESYDVSGSAGTIQGTGLTYDMGPLGRIGVTSVQQLVGSNSSNGLRTEAFQGFGRPGDQYPLQFEPIPGSIIVTVDGAVRSFSPVDNGATEFYLNPTVPNVVISRVAIPSTQTLLIKYQPKVVTGVSGDRKVTGIDWRLPIGAKNSGSSLTYSRARSDVASGGNVIGDAEGVDLRMVHGKSEFKFGVRNIDPSYQTIEQTGFNRNEQAADYAWNYVTGDWTAGLRTVNSSLQIGNGATLSPVRVLNNEFKLRQGTDYTKSRDRGRSRSFTYNQTRSIATSDNILNTLSYNEDMRMKKLTFGYGVENQTGRGRINGTDQDISIRSLKTTGSYDAGKNLGINFSASKSAVKVGSTNSDGMDYSLNTVYSQTGPWSASLNYTLSDSGALASLGGFLNGNSLGYGNNGFGNSGGVGVISTGALKSNRTSLSTSYNVSDKLSATLSFARTNTEGISTSNTRLDTLGLNASVKIGPSHTFAIDFVRVNTTFLTGVVGKSDSDVLSGYFMGNPGKFWSYGLGFNFLKSTGNSFAQDNTGLNGDIAYRLNERSRLFANASISRTRGFFPQDDISAQAGYSYMLGSGVYLVGKYHFRDLRNLDPQSTGGAFRSNGLSLELTFDLYNRR